MFDVSGITYESACSIANVPKERGYVTVQEVVNAINERFGLNFQGSDQVGWLKDPPAYILNNDRS